jgi:type VI secretion system secreted protein Hcp
MSQEEANQIVREHARRRRMLRPPMKVLLPAVAALGAGAAVAAATIPGSDNVIHGCYVTDTSKNTLRYGALRVIDPSQPGTLPSGAPNAPGACLPDEATINWNQQGPQGPAGLPGAAGSPGAQGAPGAAGQNLIGDTGFSFGGGGQTFLKIEGINGDAKQAGYVGDFAISSYSIGVGGGAGGGASGAGAGKTSFHDLTFTKPVDKSSPALFAAAVQGKHFTSATLHVRKAGEKPVEYLKLKLSDVLVSSYKTGTGHDAVPTESVSLNFTKIEMTFTPSGSSGQKVKPVTATINLSQQGR